MATLNWTTYTLIAERTYTPGGSVSGNLFERIYGKVTAQDELNNTTTVSLEWRVGRTKDGSGIYDSEKWRRFTAPNMSPATLSKKIDIDAKGALTDANVEKKLFTWTAVFTHDADGTYSETGTMTIPTFYGSGTYTATGNITLPAINRASTVTATPQLLQSGNVTITVNAFNDTNKNTITYVANGTAYTLGTDETAVGGVITKTVPYATLQGQIGSFVSAEIMVTVVTKNSSDVSLGSNTTSFVVNTGSIPFSLKDDMAGTVGATVGERATMGGFNVMIPTRFKLDNALGDVLADYVVDKGYSMTASSIAASPVYTPGGNNDTQTWRKWNSGLMELWGNVWIVPTANAVSYETITFPYTLDTSKPITATTTAFTGVPGSQVQETSVSSITNTGCRINIYRNNTTHVAVNYHITGYVA